MPPASQPADLHIAGHIRLACEDFRAAKILLPYKNRSTAYHLEQAVEKLLLALLVAEDVQVERKDAHRLDVLKDAIPEENPLRDDFTGLVKLTVYATTARYPKTGGRLTPDIDYETVPGILEAIEGVIRKMVRHFGVDPKIDATSPAANVSPPRRSEDGSGGGASGGPRR